MFCWYEHQIHPYFRVGPLQVELLSKHPQTEVVMIDNAVGKRLLAFLRNDTGRHFRFNLPSIHSMAEVNANSPDNDLRLWTLQLASRMTGLKTTEEIEILVNDHAAGGYHKVHGDSVRLHANK